MDVCNLRFKNNIFDVIISFDVLEHLDSADQEKFLSEINRVIKSNGTLYVGSPNKALGQGNNSHYLKELNKVEFGQTLKKYFKI